MAILTVLLFLYVFAVGWTKNLSLAATHSGDIKITHQINALPENAVFLAQNNCARFHGAELKKVSLNRELPSLSPKSTAEQSLALILALH